MTLLSVPALPQTVKSLSKHCLNERSDKSPTEELWQISDDVNPFFREFYHR